MFTSAAKTLLKNHIRHADTHNRMVEESEMWATHAKLSDMDKHQEEDRTDTYRRRGDRTNSKYEYERRRRPNQPQGRNDSHDSFLYDHRDDSESPEDRCGAYMDRLKSEPVMSSRDLERLKKSQKTKQDLEAGIDRWDHSGFEKQNPRSKGQEDGRWDHSGYRKMYPGDFGSDHGKKQKSNKSKSSKKKKYKKRKKKRSKYVSSSEDERKKEEEEKLNRAALNTKVGSWKKNSDLELMERFTSEVRPKKPSKPRMKMRTWNSESSADSDSDSRYHREKSQKYKKKKSRRKHRSDSSMDSSSDSESEDEQRDRRRKRVKKGKKRRYESDFTSSDSRESCPSSKKKIRSSRTESSESPFSSEEYSDKSVSDKTYSRRKYSESSGYSDSDYSTSKKHKKKKKKMKKK